MEKTTKMTEREIYTALLEGTIDHDTLAEFCEKKLTALDKRNEHVRAKAAEKRAEGDALQETVLSVMTDEYATREEIAERVGQDEATVSKVGYRISQLVKAGKVEKDTMTFKGEDGKTKRTTVYRLAFPEDVE